MSIAALATAQHGVVTLQQLWSAGLGNNAIYHRVRCGRLHRLYRGVYAVGHKRLTREGRWLAAVLALGNGAALSHVSAAALWGMRGSEANRIHVTVPTIGGRGKRNGIVIHRSRTLRAQDVITVDAIAVTTVARTLLDLAGVLAPGPLERAVERSLQLRLFDLFARPRADRGRPHQTRRTDARPHHREHPRRAGPHALRTRGAHARPLRRAPDPAPGGQHARRRRRGRLPLARAPAHRLDGHETHGTRAAFESDRARDARHTTLGYRVVRFTHRRLVHEPGDVVATLKALVSPQAHAAR